jgi:cobalt-zinc-cadmium efflux system protein
MLDDRRISEAAKILQGLRELVLRDYGIGHVTVQLECEECDPNGVIICSPGGLD